MKKEIKSYKKNVFIKINKKGKKGNIIERYKIGSKIPKRKLEIVASGIAKKALKVVGSSGNIYALKILEHKDIDILEDIRQTVALQLIENGYKIEKNCYKIVNNMLYRYKREKIDIENIFINSDSGYSNVDYNSYIEYMKNNDKIEGKKDKTKIDIKSLNLTEKQLEILNIYSKVNSLQGVADLLGIKKATVQTTIKRIREKIEKKQLLIA